MISQTRLKQLLLAGFLLQAFLIKADDDASLWAGVEDAFSKIIVADNHFKSSKLLFMHLKDDYNALLLNFDLYKEKRQAAFASIKSSTENLEIRLDAAIPFKAAREYDAMADQMTIRISIEQMRTERNAIIQGLVAARASLQDEINGLEIDLATLSAMSSEKVDKALIDFAAASDSYFQMKVEREAFMGVLDKVLAKAAAFEATQKNEIAEMGSK